MTLCYFAEPNWPPLSWIAECIPNSKHVAVRHGRGVERRDNWFCEAAWDAPFADGDFDRTDLVFGSGGRIRDGEMVFVSAGSTLDRLHSIRVGQRILVSNSLPCILAESDAELDVTDPSYSDFFQTIRMGIDGYLRELESSRGPIRFTYFRNVLWDSHQLCDIDKPAPRRDFGSFASYVRFMRESIAAIFANATAPQRDFPFEPIGTISTGYDSLAVSCLARDAGLRQAFSFRTARHGDADFGAAFADELGLELSTFERNSYRSDAMAEVPFVAADAKGEDAAFASAAPILNQKLLLTGTYGDKVWSSSPSDVTPQITRGDRSGLSLTEYRLHAGFIHFPVPVMGIRQMDEIAKISKTDAMANWDYSNPAAISRYSRPIARRIIEEAGIARHKFAVTKKAVAVLFSGVDNLSPMTLQDYRGWLSRQASRWRERGLTPPYPPTPGQTAKSTLSGGVGEALYYLSKFNLRRLQLLRHFSLRLKRHSRMGIDRFMFPWAINHVKSHYRRALTQAQPRSCQSQSQAMGSHLNI